LYQFINKDSISCGNKIRELLSLRIT
jgi:hypothetical protein